jgi:hypothetical protein
VRRDGARTLVDSIGSAPTAPDRPSRARSLVPRRGAHPVSSTAAPVAAPLTDGLDDIALTLLRTIIKETPGYVAGFRLRNPER